MGLAKCDGSGCNLAICGPLYAACAEPDVISTISFEWNAGHLDGKDIDHHLSVINPTQNMIRRHPMAGDVGSPGLYNVRYNGNFWADSNCVEPPISSPFQNLTTKDVPMRIVTDFTTWLKSLQIGCHWTPHPFLIRTGF
jgi:hypothetical protein